MPKRADLSRWIVTIFATYRMTRLLVLDDGPFDVFLELRKRAGVYEQGNNSFFAVLLRCPFCIGVYVSLVFTAFAFRPNKAVDFLIAWLSVAGGQDYLQTQANDYNHEEI